MSAVTANILIEAHTIEVPAEGEKFLRSPTNRSFYRPELDMLRFFAFAAVFVHHGIYVFSPIIGRAGGFGLSFFFMLSAFLITELLQREKSATGTIAISSFYLRRSLRIWPLYYGFLLFSFILSIVFPSHHTAWGFYFSFLLMTGNIYVGRHGFPNNPSGFLWSISIEEQFYLFWPLMNRILPRKVLGIVALLSFPLGMMTIYVLTLLRATANIGVWTNTFVQFQMFAFGVLLSLLLNGNIPQLSSITRLALFSSGLFLWFAASAWSGVVDFGVRSAPGPIVGYYLVGLGCTAIFFSAYGLEARSVPSMLVYGGKISYGLYVFHQLSLETASWLLNHFNGTSSLSHHTRYGVLHLFIGFVFSLMAAMLSYTYLEKYFLKKKELFSIIRSRAV